MSTAVHTHIPSQLVPKTAQRVYVDNMLCFTASVRWRHAVLHMTTCCTSQKLPRTQRAISTPYEYITMPDHISHAYAGMLHALPWPYLLSAARPTYLLLVSRWPSNFIVVATAELGIGIRLNTSERHDSSECPWNP